MYEQDMTVNQGENNNNTARENLIQRFQQKSGFDEQFLFETRALNVIYNSDELKNQNVVNNEKEEFFQNQIQKELISEEGIQNGIESESKQIDDINDQFSLIYQTTSYGQDSYQVLGLFHQVQDIDEDSQDEDEAHNQNDHQQKQKYKQKTYGMQISAAEHKIKEREYYKRQQLIQSSLSTKNQINFKKSRYSNNEQQNIIRNYDEFQICVYSAKYEDDMLFQKSINNGVIESNNQTILNEEIIIGRDQQLKNNNDLQIYQDSQISKQHCKIITKYYYDSDNNKIEDNLDLLFSYYEYKHRKNSNSNDDILTKVLTMQYIQDNLKKYLCQKPSFYLVDLNSRNGTQVLVDYQQSTRLSHDMFLQCGSFNLHIQEINDLKHYDSFINLISDYLLEELQREFFSEDQTFATCGLPQDYLDFAVDCFKQISTASRKKEFYNYDFFKSIQRSGLSEFYKMWIQKLIVAQMKKRNLKEFKMIPYLKIKTQRYQSSSRRQVYFLFHNEKNPKIFKVGKNQNCDISLNSNLVSRNHCEIFYNSKMSQWQIRDGLEQLNKQRKPSKNKTWINLYNDKQYEYQEVIPYKLDPDLESTIKIGNTIMKLSRRL